MFEQIKKLLSDEESLGTLLRGSGVALVLNTLGALLVLSVQIVLARQMGAEGFGIYAFVLSWVVVLMLPAQGGFEVTLVRFLAPYRKQGEHGLLRGLLRASLCWTSLAGVAIAFFLYLGSSRWVAAPELRAAFLMGCFLLPVLSLSSLRQAALRAFKMIAKARLPDMVIRPGALLFCVLTFSIVLGRELSAPIALFFHLVGALLAFTLGTVWLQRSVAQIDPENTPRESDLPLWFRTTFPLMFVSGMHIILNELDKLMLGVLADVRSVGLYSAASQLSFMVIFGMHAINAIAAPLIAEYFAAHSRDELQKLVTHISRMIFLVSFPFVVLLVLFGPWLLGLFGEEFLVAYPALLVLALGQCVSFSVGPVGFLLTMTGHERVHLRILIVTAVVNVCLNVPLILAFGIEGAAVATALSIALRNLLSWQKSRELVQVNSAVWNVWRSSP